MGGISIWQLLIVAIIIVLLFGTKKLRNMGGDLGSAVKGFKNALTTDDVTPSETLDEKSSLEDKRSVGEVSLVKEKHQA